MLKAQVEQFNSYLEEVTNKIAELTSTKQALEEISQVEQGTDAFVPLSQGIFLKAKLEKADKLLIAVGGDTAAEKTVDQVKEIINNQIVEAENAHLQLQENLGKAHSRLPKLMKELQELQDVQES